MTGPMIPINRTYAPLQALAEELARCGMRHAVTCPGSRNAPLILALAGEPGIECMSVIDERSAGYLALGMAKASGTPVAVTCTSGTAAANLAPAVAEAREARVPLVVLTGDRPPELRDIGAGQAIDQLKLYGDAVKWFVEVGSHAPGRESAVHHRSLGCRGYWTAASGRPGPVHLNFALREPLAPEREELCADDWRGREGGRPWVELRAASDAPHANAVQELADEIAAAAHGVLVCGPTAETALAGPAARLAGEAGWSLLAEPTSGLRCGPHDRSHVIAHYDALLRAGPFADEHVPELVIRIGDTPTSKPLRALLARSRQVVIDPHQSWHEPTRSAELIVAAAAAPACDALAAALEMRALERDPEWLDSWRTADALVPPQLEATPDPFEPKAYAALADSLPEGALLWLSSSMPVRDVEAFFPQTERQLRFLANRGANGIDGVVSSAAGAALATGGRCHLLTGELALLHDLGGLHAAARNGAELTIVCVNNGGGGIFDFLPVAEHAGREDYERHIATPGGVDLARVAALFELPHELAATPAEVRAAAARPGLVEVRTDRARNVELHRDLARRVAARF